MCSSSFNMVGQPFGTGNMPCCNAAAVIFNPISVCQTSQYTISFAARQSSPSAQTCGFEIGWNDSNYASVQTPQINSSWNLYGPTQFESTFLGYTADNPDGSFNTRLTIFAYCYGVKGVTPPATVQLALDSLIIKPA